jgi:hypothetical protein
VIPGAVRRTGPHHRRSPRPRADRRPNRRPGRRSRPPVVGDGARSGGVGWTGGGSRDRWDTPLQHRASGPIRTGCADRAARYMPGPTAPTRPSAGWRSPAHGSGATRTSTGTTSSLSPGGMPTRSDASAHAAPPPSARAGPGAVGSGAADRDGPPGDSHRRSSLRRSAMSGRHEKVWVPESMHTARDLPVRPRQLAGMIR